MISPDFCSLEAISVLLSDSRGETEAPPGLARPRQSKQVDEGLTQEEEGEGEGEESARQTLSGQESCEVTGYEMRRVQLTFIKHFLFRFFFLKENNLQ